MAYTLTQPIGATQPPWRRGDAAEDPLAPVRGIVVATLLSVLGFWLPLAVMLTQ